MTYLDELAERIRAHVPAELLPSEDTAGLFRSYAVLLLAKGQSVTYADVHNAWSAWIAVRNPDHESLVPFDQLDEEAAASDAPFVEAIRRVAIDLTLKTGVAPDVASALLPNGLPLRSADRAQMFELYKLMVSSSEALVARRQGVNTFFLTANGALLTAIGLVVRGAGGVRLPAGGVAILALAGTVLCLAWWSLLRSFGQLNRGKFVVINALETMLPAAVYAAEWKALGEGKDRRVYVSFTERETWVPKILLIIYILATCIGVLVAFGVVEPSTVWDPASVSA